MNEFDIKAKDWDKNQMHIERAEAIALAMLNTISIEEQMTAIEYGAGTGLLSFNLKDRFSKIILMDSSREMVRMAQQKIADEHIKNMSALCIDLENEEFSGSCDMIYNQMVFHHVENIDLILQKIRALLNPGGYLVIADLYAEDGSFHGEAFTGPKGFDVANLSGLLKSKGFKDISHQECYRIKKTIEDGKIKEFPVFLMIGKV
jgi:ubiquinone/menaquinone biosynthesis C-methylase UbiE